MMKSKTLSQCTTEELIAELELRENFHVAREIRQVRQSLGLTMKEFGELFKPIADNSIVSRWEKGKSVPNAIRLHKIKKLAQECTPS